MLYPGRVGPDLACIARQVEVTGLRVSLAEATFLKGGQAIETSGDKLDAENKGRKSPICRKRGMCGRGS